MENKPQSVLVVFGENVHFREGKKYLESRESKTHPIQDYTSEAAGGLMLYDYKHAQLWPVGGDVAEVGISEAEQIEASADGAYPEMSIDARIFPNALETWSQAEDVKKALDNIDHEVSVSTEFPITHRLQANRALENQGIDIDHKHWAEFDYINAPHTTPRIRNERRWEIGKILLTKNTYFDYMRGLGLYFLSFVDKKGRIPKKIAEIFRDRTEQDHETMEIYDADEVTQSSPK